MKVIDLLNKIANGEEVPKRIKYWDINYKYDKCDYFSEDIDDERLSSWINFDKKDLNDEIEIIEDTPKEDKKIKRIEERESGWWPNMADGNVSTLKQAINEIIDRLNGE